MTHRGGGLPRRVYNHANPLFRLSRIPNHLPGGHMAKTGPLATPATILVAEDSADTRALLRRALASYGYEVVEATDGRTADC